MHESNMVIAIIAIDLLYSVAVQFYSDITLICEDTFAIKCSYTTLIADHLPARPLPCK